MCRALLRNRGKRAARRRAVRPRPPPKRRLAGCLKQTRPSMSAVSEHGIDAESAHSAIDDYHSFLAANPQIAGDSQEMLERLSHERGLVFRDEPFSRYLRPHLVTASQHAVITDVVGT